VWLRTPVDRLVERLASGTAERPLLSEDVRTTLCAQQAEREALYAEVATHVVETDGLDPAEVARLVVQEVTGG
jgi:shikimate kinase